MFLITLDDFFQNRRAKHRYQEGNKIVTPLATEGVAPDEALSAIFSLAVSAGQKPLNATVRALVHF